MVFSVQVKKTLIPKFEEKSKVVVALYFNRKMVPGSNKNGISEQ